MRCGRPFLTTMLCVTIPAHGLVAWAGNEPLAWLRFETGQRYAETPYRFTGDGPIRVRIDVTPVRGRCLDLLWGSKRDERGATVTINGREQTLRAGGYDGFRWQRVLIPADLTGDAYDVLIEAAAPKAGFVGAIRLVSRDAPLDAELDTETPRHRITVLEPQPPRDWPSLAEYAAMPPLERHAAQANRALWQCRRFVQGWLRQADPRTGLIPRNLGSGRDVWNAQDSAADNYAFMVLTCVLTDRELLEGRMLDMLRTEERLTSRLDQLPDTYSFSRQAFESEETNLARMIFGGSEYVKDGLMPLTEWLGPTAWSKRMLGILDSIIEHAPYATPGGPIPSDNVEVNGEMMQVLGRVHFMTGDSRYLDMAVRIADYYLLGDHHPTRDLGRLRLDDHSCELVSGLTEVYFACHHARPEKAAAYRVPIQEMLDCILEIGFNEDGLMVDTVDPVAGKVIQGALTDNWGYNLNGFYTVCQLDGIERYRAAVLRALRSLSLERYREYPWEGWGSDGIADSVEGAINLYNRERVEGVEAWIDANIDRMLKIQKADGVVEGWHGDGNFARTAILYALWKQQGVTVQPWREDVLLGAAEVEGGVDLLVSAETPWEGRLIFDSPRHRVILRLPADYPRINQIPEWFTVEATEAYTVRAAGGAVERRSGAALVRGMPVRLEGGESLRLSVRVPDSGRQ